VSQKACCHRSTHHDVFNELSGIDFDAGSPFQATIPAVFQKQYLMRDNPLLCGKALILVNEAGRRKLPTFHQGKSCGPVRNSVTVAIIRRHYHVQRVFN
jgi:hypothetical protein